MADEEDDFAELDATNDDDFAKFIAEGDDAPEAEPKAEPAAGDPDPAPAAEPEQPAKEQTGERPDASNPDKATVPLREHLNERDRRKAADKRADDLEKRLAELEAAAAPAKEAPAPADPLTDPEGFLKQQDDRFASVAEKQEAIAQQQAEAQFVHAVQLDVQRAKAEGPDYDAAYAFAIQSRTAELKAIHPGATDEDISGVVARDELALAQAAVQRGERPSEALKRWAASRGYQAASGGDPAAPAAKSSTVPKDEARARNQSLSSASGTKEPADALAAMGYDEQGELSDKEWEDKMRRAGRL